MHRLSGFMLSKILFIIIFAISNIKYWYPLDNKQKNLNYLVVLLVQSFFVMLNIANLLIIMHIIF